MTRQYTGEADCNTLQHSATHYDTLQHTQSHGAPDNTEEKQTVTRCNTLLRTATRCYTLLHVAPDNTSETQTATHWRTLEIAMCCSVLQCVAVCYSVLLVSSVGNRDTSKQCIAVCCSKMRCVAVCCGVICGKQDI